MDIYLIKIVSYSKSNEAFKITIKLKAKKVRLQYYEKSGKLEVSQTINLEDYETSDTLKSFSSIW